MSPAAALLIGAALAAAGGRQDAAPRQPVPVLAELFTSEGCSSCPPADDLLRRLIEEQPVEGVEVIGLSEHVDYWDRLGWKDRFSSSAFSRRQSDYADAFRRPVVYTPQLVVDGRLEVAGSEWPDVKRALVEAARQPRATLTVRAARQHDGTEVALTIEVRDLPASAASGRVRPIVAIVEDGLTTNVLRGENAAKQLRHAAVTRTLDSLPPMKKGETVAELSHVAPLNPDWKIDDLRVVVFLQDERTRHVLGAAAAKIQSRSGAAGPGS